jgi:hypothetical protein
MIFVIQDHNNDVVDVQELERIMDFDKYLLKEYAIDVTEVLDDDEYAKYALALTRQRKTKVYGYTVSSWSVFK